MNMRKVKLNLTAFAIIVVSPFIILGSSFAQEVGDTGSWWSSVWQLFTSIFGEVWAFLIGVVTALFHDGIRDKIDEYAIRLRGQTAELSCTNFTDVYGLSGETKNTAINNSLKESFPPPTTSDPDAYSLHDIKLSTRGKRARFRATLQAQKDNEIRWSASVIGRGRFVRMGENFLQGSFYLQCECETFKDAPDKDPISPSTWQAVYVFASDTKDPYAFDGHWLLRDAQSIRHAGFGTMQLWLQHKLTWRDYLPRWAGGA